MSTEQEKKPHKSLVQVRNTIETVTKCTRKQAAEIANGLTASQCDKVVEADGDAAKVAEAIKPIPKPKAAPKAEEKADPKKGPAKK